MQEYIITDLLSPMRLDRYLRILSPSLTQGVIEQSLRKGFIKVGGAKASANTRVSGGDVIHIADHIPMIAEEKDQVFTPQIISLAGKLVREYLIRDHEEFLAFHKPSGLSSQGGSNISLSVDHVLQYLNTQGHDLRLVHRLDKETSGVMLIAKNRLAATKLGEAFHDHIIQKKYLAILSGGQISREGRIESYLMKVHDKVEEAGKEDERAKLAITDFRVITSRPDGKKLVEFTPRTGRMHQIRCHAAYSLKNPIIGDSKYGWESSDYLMLHAACITIPAEIFGDEFVIEAKKPKYFIAL